MANDYISRQSLLDKAIYVELANGNKGWVIEKGYVEDLPGISIDIVKEIDFAIKATNIQDEYSRGMRNGMRYIKSLIDGEKPIFEGYEDEKCNDGISGNC